MGEVGCQYWPPRVPVLQFKTLMGIVFKPHLNKREDLHPVCSGRQDPTEYVSLFRMLRMLSTQTRNGVRYQSPMEI